MINKTIMSMSLLLGLCGILAFHGKANDEKELSPDSGGKTGGRKLVLAEQGQTKYVILQAADASPVELRAVKDLAEYLKKISGAAFPIVTEDKDTYSPKIIVGKNMAQALLGKGETNSLGLDDFIVRTFGDNVVLAGGGPRGTAFSVYSFLERDLGCIWFNPFGDEYVPQKSVLPLAEINRSETPSFRYRVLNTPFWKMVPYEREGAFLLRNKIVQSGQTEWGGVDRVYANPGMHSIFFYLVPPESINPAKNHYHDPKDVEPIFKEHPEWFSLVGGKRVSDRQLCFSNPELRKTFTSNFLGNIEKYSGKGVFNVSPRDVGHTFCECEECQTLVKREGNVRCAPMLDFVAELAKTVKEKYPEAVISTWAYNETECPISITFPDNVVLDFMPLEKKNFAASLEHPSNAKAVEDLRMWKTKISRFDTWYYPNPYGGSFAPIGNLRNLYDDFRLYKRLGMEGFYYLEHDAGVMETHHLTDLQTWLIAKLEWDADQDLDKLIMTFTEPYYGAAAPLIREWINCLEKSTRDMKTPISWAPTIPEFTYLTPVFLREAQALFDRAEIAVANDPIRLLRVQQARMSLDRVSLLLWDKTANDAVWTKQKKEEIAKRYEETFSTTAQQRLLKPKFKDVVLKSFALFLRINTTGVPLPAEFAYAHVKRLIPNTLLDQSNTSVIDDPGAAIGRALMCKTQGESPLVFGYYDQVDKKHLCGGKITKEQIGTAGYKFYKMGRAKLSPKGYAWTANWKMQIALDSLFDATQPDCEYDFYVSIRFEGSAYLAGQEGKTDAIFVDQFVFVPVEVK